MEPDRKRCGTLRCPGPSCCPGLARVSRRQPRRSLLRSPASRPARPGKPPRGPPCGPRPAWPRHPLPGRGRNPVRASWRLLIRQKPEQPGGELAWAGLRQRGGPGRVGLAEIEHARHLVAVPQGPLVIDLVDDDEFAFTPVVDQGLLAIPIDDEDGGHLAMEL